MIRTIKSFALCLLSLGSMAQSDSLWNRFPVFFDHPFRTVKSPSFMALEGGYTFDATSATNDLLWKLTTKQYLDKPTILRNADRAKAKNLLAIDGGASATYYNLNKGFMKKDSLHWLVRYGYRDHTGASYSEDFFRLLGIGNAAFQGDTANGNGLMFQSYRFDFVDFGLIKFYANRSNFSLSVGLTRGMKLIDVDGDRFSVYTAEFGTSTYWDIDVNAKMTRGIEQGFGYVHGMGAQLNAEYKGLLTPTGAVSVGVRNLGFIKWKGSEYEKVAQFTYDGWNVPTWGDLDRGSAEGTYDSIAQEFRPDSAGYNRAHMLPAYIYAEYTMKLKEKHAVTFRFDQVLFTPMVPRFSIAYTTFFRKFYSTTAISFLGYSRLSVNEELGYRFGRHFVRLQLYGIEAWAFPKKASGFGGGLGYSFVF